MNTSPPSDTTGLPSSLAASSSTPSEVAAASVPSMLRSSAGVHNAIAPSGNAVPTATGAAALPVVLLMFLLSRWSGGLVTRYGPKAPLVIGPLILATGFLLFAVPVVGASYWKSFFPAFIVLGLGMAISVAPLTTVVMGSADQKRAGAASGINNAVARVASVLAIAILGIVMVRMFRSSLVQSLSAQALPPGILQYIQSNAIKLAGLDLPIGLDANTIVTIRASISHAFVFGFRIEMLICSGLSVASGVVAWLMVPGKVD